MHPKYVITVSEHHAAHSLQAFVIWLSKCLRKEYSDTRVIIQTVTPMMVVTQMTHNRRARFYVPNARTFARSALNTVGLATSTCGYFWHELQSFSLFVLSPMPIFDWMVQTNARALKKHALRQQVKT